MASFYVIVPVAVFSIGVVVILMIAYRKGKETGDRKTKKLKSRDRGAIVREANRRLSQNPKDADALRALADLYYQEEDFAKSAKTYGLLIDLCATNKEINEFEVTVRYGISALRLGRHNDAHRSLVIASAMDKDSFELNYNLGYLEYVRKNVEKAAALLNLARRDQPEHPESLKYLGLSLYRLKKYADSAEMLKRSRQLAPEDKETQFVLARAYQELNQHDNALQIFTHLRPDPEVGPNACLFSGTLRMSMRDYENAIVDFEIGLRHEKTTPEISLELRYRLAAAYIQTQHLSEAIALLEEVYLEKPDYKDAKAQIQKYKELSLNQNLQTYLLGNTSDFVALCRKLAALFFPGAKVKVIDVSVQKAEYADILAEVNTDRWEDMLLFRFVRTSGKIGELMLRDMYARIKEERAGRGICVGAGTFSEGAESFVEARPIDLIEKVGLVKKLNVLGKRGG